MVGGKLTPDEGSSVGVTIPVRGQHELTRDILRQLKRMPDWHVGMIFNNGDDEETALVLALARQADRRLRFIGTDGDGIYRSWQRGYRWAKHAGLDYLAFLNNDLRLSPDTFRVLAATLDNHPRVALAYPDYDALDATPGVPSHYHELRATSGTYRHGGMGGFCFMLRVAAVDWEPLIDPALTWWGGDDDLAYTLEAKGWDQVRVIGLPIAHLSEGTARHHPELAAHKARDLAYVMQKWGR